MKSCVIALLFPSPRSRISGEARRVHVDRNVWPVPVPGAAHGVGAAAQYYLLPRSPALQTL